MLHGKIMGSICCRRRDGSLSSLVPVGMCLWGWNVALSHTLIKDLGCRELDDLPQPYMGKWEHLEPERCARAANHRSPKTNWVSLVYITRLYVPCHSPMCFPPPPSGILRTENMATQDLQILYHHPPGHHHPGFPVVVPERLEIKTEADTEECLITIKREIADDTTSHGSQTALTTANIDLGTSYLSTAIGALPTASMDPRLLGFPVVVLHRLEIKSEKEEPNTEDHDGFPVVVPDKLKIKSEKEEPNTEDHLTPIKWEIVAVAVNENCYNQEQNWSSDMDRSYLIPCSSEIRKANDPSHKMDTSKQPVKHGGEITGLVQHTSHTDSECAPSKSDDRELRSSGSQPFVYSECDKSFSPIRDLFRHLSFHTSKQPFTCTEWGQSLSLKGNLFSHQRIHTGEKYLNCTECGKQFSTKGNLMTHQRIHRGEKPFPCSECGKSFSQKNNLFIHQRIHTGVKPFACTECGKRFSQKNNLLIHQRTHTGDKPFVCSECGKQFCNKGKLRSHQNVHSGEKCFKCSVCEKQFSTKGNLLTHHMIHKRKKPFPCAECGERFSQKNNLLRHQRIHTEEKSFV